MLITFTYKKVIYTLEAINTSIIINGQLVEVCYPINFKSEWIIRFGKHHSPLFYVDDHTPVLALYKTSAGRSSYFQAFVDTEDGLVLKDISVRLQDGSYRTYYLQEIITVRRVDRIMIVR